MFNVFQKFVGDVPEKKVIEKNIDSVANLNLIKRDDSMVLFSNHEIVLYRPANDKPKSCYSLYRANSGEAAQQKFETFENRVPNFVQIVKEMYNISGLQKICDVLSENPKWSIAHLVAYFNLVDYVSNPSVLEFINYSDPISHMTPLHVACSMKNTNCVNAFLCADADVNASNLQPNLKCPPSTVAEFFKKNGTNKVSTKCMKTGGTPLHWCKTRETIDTLVQGGCNINLLDFEGKTALHVMVAKNKLDCVVSLLAHEALIDMKDKDGNTALHIAVEKKLISMVQCLIVFGCNMNLRNNKNQTPRHMVGNEALGTESNMILYILNSVGAKRCPSSCNNCPSGCNSNGTYDGVPPLKPETTPQKDTIQQMLASVTMGSNDGNSQQKEGQTSSINEATTQQKISHVMDKLLDVFATKIQESSAAAAASIVRLSSTDRIIKPVSIIREEQEEEIPSVQAKLLTTPRKPEDIVERGRLLCLDGGGIRGLVLVQILLEIEQLSQEHIGHMFDWIAGTSTGGILALAIASGKTMKECMCLYLRMKDLAFVGTRPYASDPFEQVLKDGLGEHTVMSDIKHPKVMVTAVMADIKPADLHLFKNYKSATDLLDVPAASPTSRVAPAGPESQLIWRVARATGAAPTYFRAFGRFVDGGLIANNPTLDALTEIHEYNIALQSVDRQSEVVPLSVVVSLGTGMPPLTEQKEIDVFIPDSLWDMKKLVNGISAIGNLLVDQATLADGRVVDRARAWCSMIGVPYFRFNPQMSVDMAMDETIDVPLVNMMWETKAYMYQNRERVLKMIQILKQT